MNVLRTFLSIFLIALAGRSVAEEIVFEMSVLGIRFGTMTVTRTIENDSTELYTLHAKGKTDFLFMQRDEESRYRVRYRNGALLSSEYMHLIKGKTEKWSRITKAEGHYRVETNSGVRVLQETVDYSLLKLYFEPGQKRTRVFCEEDCAFSRLDRNPSSDSFTVTCKDGSRSTYHLKAGRVDRVELHLAAATVKMTRVR
jgi:hypothetical protein